MNKKFYQRALVVCIASSLSGVTSANFKNPFAEEDNGEVTLEFKTSSKQVSISKTPSITKSEIAKKDLTQPVSKVAIKEDVKQPKVESNLGVVKTDNNKKTASSIPTATQESEDSLPNLSSKEIKAKELEIKNAAKKAREEARAAEKQARLLAMQARLKAKDEENRARKARADARKAEQAKIDAAKLAQKEAERKAREEKKRLEQEKVKEANRLKLEQEQARKKAQAERRAAEQAARLKAEAEKKAQAEALAKADAERKAAAEQAAKLKIEAERKALLEAKAKAKAEADRKLAEEHAAKLKAEADRKAAEQAAKLKAEEERKAAEQAAKLKAEADRKAAEQAAKLKAEADRKATEELAAKLKAEEDRKLAEQAAKLKAEADRKAKEDAEKWKLEYAAKQQQSKPLVLSPEADKGISSVFKFGPFKASEPSAVMGQTYANKATQSALQRATAKLAVDQAKMPLRNKVLGFTASQSQVESLNERYKYDSSKMTVMPKMVGEVKLLPTIRLMGDSISLFATNSEKEIVEEYFSYYPLHAEVFRNYVKRTITMNEGKTSSITVDQAIIDELTYNYATTPVPSTKLSYAQDTYLYHVSRLSDADLIKFWNWVNTVKTGDEVKVPTWIRLSDVMYSQ